MSIFINLFIFSLPQWHLEFFYYSFRFQSLSSPLLSSASKSNRFFLCKITLWLLPGTDWYVGYNRCTRQALQACERVQCQDRIYLMQHFLSSAIYHSLDVELLINIRFSFFTSTLCYFTLGSGQALKLD